MTDGNRFQFLEIEDGAPAAPASGTAAAADAPPAGSEPREGLMPDGTALAEVRITDPRGLFSQMEPAPATGNGAPSAARTLRVVDLFGERGSRAGQFVYPTGLAVDGRGILFIADSANHRIQRVTPSGGVSAIGAQGSGRAQFRTPQAIAVDAQNAFYVLEQGNARIQKFSAAGVLELVFGRPGSRDGEFQAPTGLIVSAATGDILVADTGNSRVQRFDSEGGFISSLGARGSGLLTRPQALTLDATDNLYVADTPSSRVLHFDPLGRFVRCLGGDAEGGGLFSQPRALACDRFGRLYVADSGMAGAIGGPSVGRVQVLDIATGHVRTTVEHPGRGLSALARPSGLAAGLPSHAGGKGALASGDAFSFQPLYVADTMNHRILHFVWD